MHFMICVSGFAGVGKDEFCRGLVSNHSAVHTGLIDAGKRHMAEIYGFTEEQLFGPSKFRNLGDVRFPKDAFHEHGLYKTTTAFGEDNIWLSKDGMMVEEGDPSFWLSPREALQRYGELLNSMYLDTWIRLGVNTHRTLALGGYRYSRMFGVVVDESIPKQDTFISCFSDFRHHHEIRNVRSIKDKDFKAVLVRIKSKRVPRPTFAHRSETEQVTIPDSDFDYVIHNDGDVSQLHGAANSIISDLVNNVPALSIPREIWLI